MILILDLAETVRAGVKISMRRLRKLGLWSIDCELKEMRAARFVTVHRPREILLNLQDSSYQRLLAETLLADRDPARILAFKNKVR